MSDDLREAYALYKAGQWGDCLARLDAEAWGQRVAAQVCTLRYNCLIRLERKATAREVLQAHLQRAPDDEFACVNIGWAHWLMGDAEPALQMARVGAARFPRNLQGRFNLLRILLAVGTAQEVMVELHDTEQATDSSDAFWEHLDHFKFKLLSVHTEDSLLPWDRHGLLGPRPGAAGELGPLLGQFESLGIDCELGLVQRQLRVEPLSLLRWAGITLPDACRALDEGFAAYDQDDNFRLKVTAAGEYVLLDQAYGSRTHTFVHQREADAEVLLGKLCGRQRFLRRKLLEDLAQGQKVFVFKNNNPLPRAKIDRLQEAVGRLGGRRLLLLQPAQPAHAQPGQLKINTPDFVVGHLSDFMPRIQHDQWRSLLTHAAAHFCLEGASHV